MNNDQPTRWHQLATDRSEFSTEFATVFEEQVRPPMEAIIDRLRRNGGDGVISGTTRGRSSEARSPLYLVDVS
jgi:hypothetical protein